MIKFNTLRQLVFQSLLNDSSRLMALMLLCLHGYLMFGQTHYMQLAFVMSHVGFFLMWQPLLRQSESLSWRASLAIVVIASIAIALINWWTIAFWIAGLFALIGGRVFSTENARKRLPFTLAAIYLLAILLLWVVPMLLSSGHDLIAAQFVLTYLLPVLPLLILYLGAHNHAIATDENETPNIDFFYTLLIFLLTIIVILGSYAIGVVWQIHYLKLLLAAVIALAVTLVALSWLWNPSATFSGLELLMSRYLLSLGLPFEQWIRKIAQLAEREVSAEAFLKAAMQELLGLNWVGGVTWHTQNSAENNTQTLGENTPHISTFSFQQLQLTLYSHWQFSPAMYLHVQLLTQILGEFYEAKRREEAISQHTYTKALYETGSRLTHDIKNILQSLGGLCAAVEQPNNAEHDARLITLVKKQLPLLNQRLALTLAKLEQPSNTSQNHEKLAVWWKNFRHINLHLENAPYRVQFAAPENLPSIEVDTDVLDSVIDNLLHNALQKFKQSPDMTIKVEILPAAHFCLEVSDTGAAIEDAVLAKLFKAHISSKNGLGVGLYHAAQQASSAGYQLSVYENTLSMVKFRLEKVA